MAVVMRRDERGESLVPVRRHVNGVRQTMDNTTAKTFGPFAGCDTVLLHVIGPGDCWVSVDGTAATDSATSELWYAGVKDWLGLPSPGVTFSVFGPSGSVVQAIPLLSQTAIGT